MFRLWLSSLSLSWLLLLLLLFLGTAQGFTTTATKSLSVGGLNYENTRASHRIGSFYRKFEKRSSQLSASSSSSSAAAADSVEPTPEESQESSGSFPWTSLTLAIAVPAWISMMADPLLSLMDTAFVGRLGSAELAALGACTSIFHLAFHAFRATTQATTTLVATAETTEEKQQVTQVSLMFGVAMGLGVLVFLKYFGTWAIGRMGIETKSPLYRPAFDYLQTRAWAGPAVLALTVAEGAFRGYGDTRIPLLASVVASAINLVLDPVLMFPLGWGVTGAAAATALSQVGALSTYLYYLVKRNMLPSEKTKTTASTTTKVDTKTILSTIISANLAMTAKQASLLLGWAYATARATRLGPEHVAAHQVGLSFWLLFAFWLDGAAVAAQVLLSQSISMMKKIRSLTKYMLNVATGQGVLAATVVLGLGTFVPTLFTTDKVVQYHLGKVIPILAWQQPLISWTLMAESLAAGGQQFGLLAGGTILSTLFSVWQTRSCTSVREIWSRGIVSLFGGRLLTALIGVARVNGVFERKQKQKPIEENQL